MKILYSIIIVIGSFSFLGFILSKFLKKENERLYDIKKVSADLITGNSWLKALAPFITFFFLAINFLLWGLFALDQILLFLLMLATWLKHLILWVWNSVLEPTIIFVIKMIWHYPIVFIWRNTELAFSIIKPALNLNGLKIAAKELSKLISVLFILYIFNSIIDQSWFLIIAFLLGVVATVYTLITVGVILSNNNETHPAKNNIIKRFSVLIGAIILSIGLLGLLFVYKENIFISEIGFPITEIVYPFATILVFMLVLSLPFGLAYFISGQNSGSFSSFLKAILIRVPKFIFSLPFFALGAFITLILPALLFMFLDLGISTITGEKIDGHWSRVEQFKDIDNRYMDLRDSVELNNKNLRKSDSILKVDSTKSIAYIAIMDSTLNELTQKENGLLQKEIFSLKNDFYVSERQFFSFPPIKNCEKYHWVIKDSDDNIIAERKLKADTANSSVFSHNWSMPGSYSVSVVPENYCQEGDRYSIQVTVLGIPVRSNQLSISGPQSTCANKEIIFSASDIYDIYEWAIPSDAKFISGNGTNEVTVIWGNQSGLVSLRGNIQEEELSKYSSLKVRVIPMLGEGDTGEFNLPENEIADFQIPTKPFAFYDLLSINDSMQIVAANITLSDSTFKLQQEAHVIYSDEVAKANGLISSQHKQLIITWFSTLFGMIGLSLLILLMVTPAMSYFFKFNYTLYGFHEDGEYNITRELNYLKEKDAKQPLFGWFILAFAGMFMVLVFGLGSIKLEIPQFNTSDQNEPIELGLELVADSVNLTDTDLTALKD